MEGCGEVCGDSDLEDSCIFVGAPGSKTLLLAASLRIPGSSLLDLRTIMLPLADTVGEDRAAGVVGRRKLAVGASVLRPREPPHPQ